MTDFFIGIDVGTSGMRGMVIDQEHNVLADAKKSFLVGQNNDPNIWWQNLLEILSDLFAVVDASSITAIAIDGTSGTVLAVDEDGQHLDKASMYHEKADPDLVTMINNHAPKGSPASSATSPLARAMAFVEKYPHAKILHQADYLAMRLTSKMVGDDNNALKTGFDPISNTWPEWIGKAGLDITHLPKIVPAGDMIGNVTDAASQKTGLPITVKVIAGTTDGCASFYATGACEIGDAVSALGSTLTVKLMSDTPINVAENGIYSHRFLGGWLAGGASNTGGAVLRKYFSDEELTTLSARINSQSAPLAEYYPLCKIGERFPIADPLQAPVLSPRPVDDADFLHAIFEGMAKIEARGYRLLETLGAAKVTALRTVGGGARNTVYRDIRQKHLQVPFGLADAVEAAFGTAKLAHYGFEQHG